MPPQLNDTAPALVCLDLEAGSMTLARYAAQFGARCHLPLAVLHVIQHPLDGTALIRGRQRLADLCRKILPHVGEAALHVARGLPEDLIVETASALDVSAIILGRRHRTGVDRIYVGSTTSAVISLARRPVLVVPIDDGDPQ